jgi:hypothetical protein
MMVLQDPVTRAVMQGGSHLMALKKVATSASTRHQDGSKANYVECCTIPGKERLANWIIPHGYL